MVARDQAKDNISHVTQISQSDYCDRSQPAAPPRIGTYLSQGGPKVNKRGLARNVTETIIVGWPFTFIVQRVCDLTFCETISSMSSPGEVTAPAMRRVRKSIGAHPNVRTAMDKENATVDIASELAASRKARSKSIGPGGLDSLRPGTGNRRAV